MLLLEKTSDKLVFSPRQASSKRQHHLNKHLYRPSTFLTSYEPPVFMDEDDEHAAYFGSVQDPSADDSVSPPSPRSGDAAACFLHCCSRLLTITNNLNIDFYFSVSIISVSKNNSLVAVVQSK